MASATGDRRPKAGIRLNLLMGYAQQPTSFSKFTVPSSANHSQSILIKQAKLQALYPAAGFRRTRVRFWDHFEGSCYRYRRIRLGRNCGRQREQCGQASLLPLLD